MWRAALRQDATVEYVMHGAELDNDVGAAAPLWPRLPNAGRPREPRAAGVTLRAAHGVGETHGSAGGDY